MPYSIYDFGGLAKYARTNVAEALHQTALHLAGHEGKKVGLSTEPGSFIDDFAFAIAIMTAFCAEKLEEADGQRFAKTVSALLSQQETEWGIVPDPASSVWTRRRRLAARKKVARGAARAPLETMLQTLLGGNYIGLHVAHVDEIGMFPAALGDQPQNLQPADIERKLIQIVQPISANLGVPQWVAYEPIDPTSTNGSPVLSVDDMVVVQPETFGLTETVRVEALGVDSIGGSPTAGKRTFLATFNRAHDSDVVGTVQPYGAWMSTQRSIIVVVKSAAALSPEIRRQVHEELARTMPSVSTWAVVQETAFMKAGPFQLSVSPLNATPLGVVMVP